MKNDDDINDLIREIEEWEQMCDKAQQETLEKMKEYEDQIILKDDKIKELEKTLLIERELAKVNNGRLDELNRSLGCMQESTQWEAIAKNYDKQIRECLSRIIILEKENTRLEIENKTLKDMISVDKG